MAFVRKDVLEKLLRDDKAWTELLNEQVQLNLKAAEERHQKRVEELDSAINGLLEENEKLGDRNAIERRQAALSMAVSSGNPVAAPRYETFLKDGQWPTNSGSTATPKDPGVDTEQSIPIGAECPDEHLPGTTCETCGRRISKLGLGDVHG